MARPDLRDLSQTGTQCLGGTEMNRPGGLLDKPLLVPGVVRRTVDFQRTGDGQGHI
jgi:hypothetical protein